MSINETERERLARLREFAGYLEVTVTKTTSGYSLRSKIVPHLPERYVRDIDELETCLLELEAVTERISTERRRHVN
jgi:hypothetical protein